MWNLLCLNFVKNIKDSCMEFTADDESLGSTTDKPPKGIEISEYTNWFQENLMNLEDESQNQESSSKTSNRKISEKGKKKLPWYSVLYPTYKSRSDDFKRIFKELSPEERLVVDYSCAIQRDILIHGRLYASQNFLCFYANIFRWETTVSIRWKDITSITKEKTALVIPNAILIHTETEKHFFTSFAARDKTYLMLFRIWQHALMDQPMSVQEMWHWVHVSYGEELGLNSDDEDYIPSGLDESKVASKLASEVFFEESTQGLRKEAEAKEVPQMNTMPPNAHLPSDSSDSTESEDDKTQATGATEDSHSLAPSCCPFKHEGRVLLSEVCPLPIDELFTIIFTFNKFNMDLMETMKYTDVDFAKWEEDPATGNKMRTNRLTAPVAAVGSKTCLVTETQVIKASKPGELYVVEVETVNGGVPYCDSFYIITHLCLTRLSASETTFNVLCQVKYRKSVWSIVKTFIEKNVYAGLEDFYKCLTKGLEEECLRRQAENGITSPRIKKRITKVTSLVDEFKPLSTVAAPTAPPECSGSNETTLWAILGVLLVLLLLNVFLFYKLSALEGADKEPRLASIIDTRIFGEERSHDQWISLLQKQALQHHKEIQHWKQTLKTIVSLLRQAEGSISDLQNNIQTSMSEKVVASLNPLSETEDKNSEL